MPFFGQRAWRDVSRNERKTITPRRATIGRSQHASFPAEQPSRATQTASRRPAEFTSPSRSFNGQTSSVTSTAVVLSARQPSAVFPYGGLAGLTQPRMSTPASAASTAYGALLLSRARQTERHLGEPSPRAEKSSLGRNRDVTGK